MKKIFVSKNDSVAEVVEKIIEEPETDVIVVIPKNTALEDSVSNFHLIQREAVAAGKNIIIESVDEGVLALAKASHIEAVHPLFKNRKKSSSLSDIVRTDPEAESSGDIEPEEIEEPPRSKPNPIEKKFKKVWSGFKFPNLRLISIIAVLVIIVGGFFYLSRLVSRAEITINFQEFPWDYQGEFIARTSVNKPDLEGNLLPAELLVQSKNITQTFKASGRDTVQEKATGKILIYNAFSSAPQPLVATTRFLTPDNKLFRLVKGVTVPGAQVKDGKIIPSTIEADIVADKAGVEYNLGPVERLSIPGFSGTPKYEAFYGSLIKTSGGFIGEKAVPTSEDIKSAREQVSQTLTASLETEILNNKPKDFKTFDTSSEIKIIELSTTKTSDENGNFSAFGEAEMKSLAFVEEDLKAILLSAASKTSNNLTFKNITIDYSNIKVDFAKGELRFNVSVSSALTQNFDVDKFKDQIFGKKIGDVKSLVLSLPGLDDAKVSIWPSWIKKIPEKAGKIKVIID